MLWLLSGPPVLDFFAPIFSFMYGFMVLMIFSSGIQFYVLLSPYLCFISFFILTYMF